MRLVLALCVAVLSAFMVFPQEIPEDEAAALSRQVNRLYTEGKFADALPLAKRVAELRRNSLGMKSLKTGEAFRSLAYVHLAARNFGDAERSFEKAIESYRSLADLSVRSRDELGMMFERLGLLKFENGNDGRAIELFQSAVEEREKLYGKDSVQVAQPLWSLANLYYSRKDYKSAEGNFWRVLEIRSKTVGINAWERQDAKNRYICTATKNGNKEEMNSRLMLLRDDQPDGDAKTRIIRGGVINGKATYLARPAYPVAARHAVPTGNATVQVVIDETGKVTFACTIDGDRFFWDAAERAAYKSTFSAATIAGSPVRVTGLIVYEFRY